MGSAASSAHTRMLHRAELGWSWQHLAGSWAVLARLLCGQLGMKNENIGKMYILMKKKRFQDLMRNAKGWERSALPSCSGIGKKGTGGVHSNMWGHPSTWWFRDGEEGTGGGYPDTLDHHGTWDDPVTGPPPGSHLSEHQPALLLSLAAAAGDDGQVEGEQGHPVAGIEDGT